VVLLLLDKDLRLGMVVVAVLLLLLQFLLMGLALLGCKPHCLLWGEGIKQMGSRS
jgi:hypothetical protein